MLGAGCIAAGPGCVLKIGSYPKQSLLLFAQFLHVGCASSHYGIIKSIVSNRFIYITSDLNRPAAAGIDPRFIRRTPKNSNNMGKFIHGNRYLYSSLPASQAPCLGSPFNFLLVSTTRHNTLSISRQGIPKWLIYG